MKFPESLSSMDKQENSMAIGSALVDTIKQAMVDGRVTCGVYASVKLLDINPENVMLCVLPQASFESDVTIHMQHTLIEAYCWENDISVLKIDNARKLERLLRTRDGDNCVLPDVAESDDVSCVLIEYPKSQPSCADIRTYNRPACLTVKENRRDLRNSGSLYPVH
ncbi:hypothetical protein ScPMuIL_006394 [Solemya velum]